MARQSAVNADGDALVDQIAESIRRKIMVGEIPVGSWLRQESLADELGVSRTPIREALRQLQNGGLVEILPRRGSLVRGPSTRDIREAYVVRAELEGLAAAFAAELISDEQLERLRAAEGLFRSAVDRFTATVDPALRAQIGHGEWPQANDMFHEVILEACDNRRLRDSVTHVHQSFPRNLTWSALANNSRLLRNNVEEHQRIRERIEAQDSQGARKAMHSHIERAGELIARRAEELLSNDRAA